MKTCDRTVPAGRVLRLLRLLETAGPASVEAGAEAVVLRSSKREYRFEREVLGHCLSSGLVELRDGRVRLRREGVAHLRRGQHPEAGFLAQHADLAHQTGEQHMLDSGDASPQGSRGSLMNRSESPLARLYYRRDSKGRSWLDEAQFSAGERLRRDFERAGLQPRISANWQASVASGGRGGRGLADLGDLALDARRRVEGAIATLEPSLAGAVLDICCFLKGLEQVERERGWPARSAKLMLRAALTILAGHYGLLPPQARSGAIVHWGAQDFRPAAG